MRPLRYSINVSLDGCVDHTAGSPDEEIHNHAARVIARADAIILGRTTYELMEFWRTAKDLPTWMQPFADSINAAKKYLVSSTREPDGWNTEALRGDPVEAVRKLKEQPGDGLYVGGVTLPLALADAGLIDEYEFVVYPTLVGHGPKLFDGLARPLDLRHVGTTEFSSGVRAERYVPVSRLSDSVDSDDSVPDDEEYARRGSARALARVASPGSARRAEHVGAGLARPGPGSRPQPRQRLAAPGDLAPPGARRPDASGHTVRRARNTVRRTLDAARRIPHLDYGPRS